MTFLKKIILYIQVVFYFIAGINHVVMPDVYYSMMPSWIPMQHVVNILAGIVEVVLAIMLAIPRFRRYGAIGIVLLLIAFIPVHVYMAQQAPMPFAGTILTPFWAWVRLLVAHPLLLICAGMFARKERR